MIVSAACMALPIIAGVVEWSGSRTLTERHRGHDDVYCLPVSVTCSPVIMMIFMGVLGFVMTWLCWAGVFQVTAEVPCAFFLGFLVVEFVLWLGMRRYRVVTYDDHMEVTPFAGRVRRVDYDRITSLSWTRAGSFMGAYQSILVRTDRTRALLLGILDLEQILSRVGRYDVLGRSAL